MRRGENGLSVGYFVERCQRWQVAHCLYNLSVKKGRWPSKLVHLQKQISLPKSDTRRRVCIFVNDRNEVAFTYKEKKSQWHFLCKLEALAIIFTLQSNSRE